MFGKEQPVEEAPVVTEEGGEVELSGPVTLDLGAVRDAPILEGWHAVRIERAEAGLSRQKRLPQIFVMARVTDESDPEYNRTVIWNLMLSGDGLVFTKRCFSALGLPEQLSFPSHQALADTLIGRECEAQVKHRSYKGEKQANVKNWRALTPEISF